MITSTTPCLTFRLRSSFWIAVRKVNQASFNKLLPIITNDCSIIDIFRIEFFRNYLYLCDFIGTIIAKNLNFCISCVIPEIVCFNATILFVQREEALFSIHFKLVSLFYTWRIQVKSDRPNNNHSLSRFKICPQALDQLLTHLTSKFSAEQQKQTQLFYCSFWSITCWLNHLHRIII